MNEIKIDKIKKLAEAEFKARAKVEYLSTINVTGRPYEELNKMATDYAIARADHYLAWKNLNEEITKD